MVVAAFLTATAVDVTATTVVNGLSGFSLSPASVATTITAAANHPRKVGPPAGLILCPLLAANKLLKTQTAE